MSGPGLLVRDIRVRMCFVSCRVRREKRETAGGRNALREGVKDGQLLEALIDGNGAEGIGRGQSPQDGQFCCCCLVVVSTSLIYNTRVYTSVVHRE
jgi:hypothetical protein